MKFLEVVSQTIRPSRLLDNKLYIVLLGSPWGAGTFAGREPTDSERELKMAKSQGMAFYDVVSRVRWGSAKSNLR
jgi:hypothetical protein